MAKITADSLMPLEVYAKARPGFRAQVMAHKKMRQVPLGEHVTLFFEDELTMRYQVQEMLRVEWIFEVEGIEEELAAYNPLIPDGTNWKATLMIAYADPAERARMLASLTDIENRVWVQAAGCDRVFAIADEDRVRGTDEKTSAVHFLRFELTREMAQALRRGAGLRMGADHHFYAAEAACVAPAARDALLQDLHAFV